MITAQPNLNVMVRFTRSYALLAGGLIGLMPFCAYVKRHMMLRAVISYVFVVGGIFACTLAGCFLHFWTIREQRWEVNEDGIKVVNGKREDIYGWDDIREMVVQEYCIYFNATTRSSSVELEFVAPADGDAIRKAYVQGTSKTLRGWRSV